MKSNLDTAKMAVDMAIKAGADAADAVIVGSTNTSYRQHKGKPENIEYSETRDLGIRVFVSGKEGNKIALISTNNLLESNIKSTVEKVVELANIAPADKFYRLAEKEEFDNNEIPDLQINCKQSATVDHLKNWASECEDAALSYKGVTNTEYAESSYSKNETTLVTSKGFARSYFSTGYNISVSVIAGEGTAMETDYDYCYARNREDLKNAAEIGRSAAEITVKKLNPRKIKSVKVPIVFDKRVSKDLLGNLAGAINGGSIVKESSFLLNKMGKQIFPDFVNIYDDPLIPRAIGSQDFDAEGLRGQKIPIVENGILKSWILDLRSSGKLGLKSNGRASRGINTQPSPSSTNMYMQPGRQSPSELIKNIKQGLYLTDAFGMGINGITGDYSQGANGFWIENGEITYPVSEITIAGNLLDMFMNMQAASDLEMRYSKNAPTLVIEGMTIAGT